MHVPCGRLESGSVRLSLGRVLAVVVVVVSPVVPACESEKPPPNGTCSLNSDCTQPLVCANGACRSRCKTSADCESGGVCMINPDGNPVCQSAAERNKPCDHQSDCQSPLACATDYRCRNLCRSDDDCNALGISGRLCVADTNGVTFCADASEVENGKLATDPAPGHGDAPVAPPDGAGSGGAGGEGPGEPNVSSGGADGVAGEGGSGGGGGSGAGGSSGSVGSGGSSGCASDGNELIVPDADGRVSLQDACNNVGVQGYWYAYGDQYGDRQGEGKCIKIGRHMPSECAQVTTPPAREQGAGFPNLDGMMHTAGTVENILPCVDGSPAMLLATAGCPNRDYANMWGAGIGFDLNGDPDSPAGDGLNNVWDPDAQSPPVIGIAFTIAGAPPTGLRVEFPMKLTAQEAAKDVPPITTPDPTTDSHSARAPYWGAQASGDRGYPNSPVKQGENRLYFAEASAATGIESPANALYRFDRHRMLRVEFHVVSGSASPYDFTISNVRFLRTR